MRDSTDEVTLAAPAADPDSIALGLAEMAIDPTDPRSPTVNGRPPYLDSGTAALRGQASKPRYARRPCRSGWSARLTARRECHDADNAVCQKTTAAGYTDRLPAYCRVWKIE
jgi:hypothetical protein